MIMDVHPMWKIIQVGILSPVDLKKCGKSSQRLLSGNCQHALLFIYSQTKKLQNRVTLHWTACRASS
jgi:hypothetical protein